jgi:pimeloyl-ACP methyl ester carboxylesterase
VLELVEAKLVPADGQYVKLNDLTMYYETFGTGEPLVLLHGGTATRRMWEKFVPTFSKHFKVIAPDSRGHGKTDNPSGEFGFRLMADDTAGLIRALGLERPSICGYSDGGQICIEIGMRYADVANKLVIIGAHNRLQDADIASLRNMGHRSARRRRCSKIRESGSRDRFESKGIFERTRSRVLEGIRKRNFQDVVDTTELYGRRL